MYFGDHHPPYFHAEYGEQEAIVSIDTLAVIAGKLPPRAMGMVAEWASLHQEELMSAWHKAENLEPVERVDPLP